MSGQIAILGAAGRMGRAIARGLLEETVPGLRLCGAVEAAGHPEIGCDLGELAGAGRCGVAVTDDLQSGIAGADAAIDFSFHTATAANAGVLAERGTALVIGTTGLTGEEKQHVERAAERIPILMAPNMSLGVNLLFALAERAAAALQGRGYDVEIVERHHRLKKDAPSGTALGLGEAVARGMGVDLGKAARHGRQGMTGERGEEEIGFHAVRAGDIVGDHTVLFAAAGECIELSHRATSRATFALGALRAAGWVAGKPAGLYAMTDVLGL